jgi:NAD(P)-dependent dehydrogenase (short-subunit alcohol dehydrogenase family)
MSNAFEDKVVVITGAGKGLGRAYALHFAALGASVVVNNRRHEGEAEFSADRVVGEIAAAGGKAVANYTAVEDPAAGNSLLASAVENFGRLDCLIANAGVTEGRSFRKQALEQFRDVLEINLMGTVNVVHPIFRHLCEHGGGNIIFSTSSAGLFGEFGLPAYSTSKAALIGLMRSLSLEGAPKNVQVNAIAPYAATQMTEEHLSLEISAAMAPERVAPVVEWLASGVVSGEILIAGGGHIARARMQTTRAMPATDILAGDGQQLQRAVLDLEFDSAGENFQQFMAVVRGRGDS